MRGPHSGLALDGLVANFQRARAEPAGRRLGGGGPRAVWLPRGVGGTGLECAALVGQAELRPRRLSELGSRSRMVDAISMDVRAVCLGVVRHGGTGGADLVVAWRLRTSDRGDRVPRRSAHELPHRRSQ